jgi:hypothetical protein
MLQKRKSSLKRSDTVRPFHEELIRQARYNGALGCGNALQQNIQPKRDILDTANWLSVAPSIIMCN